VLADIAAVTGKGEGGRVDYLTGRALAAKGDWRGAAQRFEAAASAAVSDAPLPQLPTELPVRVLAACQQTQRPRGGVDRISGRGGPGR